MIRPHVVNVLDAMLREPRGVRVQEIAVGDATAPRTLGDLKLPERVGITVFALREGETQRYRFNPAPDRPVYAGDVLFACADAEQLAAAKKIVTEG